MNSKILSSLVDFCRRRPAVAVMLITFAVLIIPAAITPFNTKGEPREAIVALSMLMSGDWILPVSFGVEIPYKPPLLAWLIALFSMPVGHVTELTARLPSIMACASLAGTIVSFARKDMSLGGGRSFAIALLAVTTIEVWRSAGACRVDMLLTATMTGACVMLYRVAVCAVAGGEWRRRILYFSGTVVMMTAAMLTKGPVGIVLSCLIIAVWAFWMRLGWRDISALALVVCLAAVLSVFVPLWWYWEAYSLGGDRFLDLVLEENFGRMTGTMSYASHLNPWWYNLQTLVAGLLPYTIIAILALFKIRWRRDGAERKPLGSAARLAVSVCVVTLIFYTIPASKRSVYLLPMYPFLAIGLFGIWEWLWRRSASLAHLFSRLIKGIALFLAVALIAAPFQPWVEGLRLWICWPAAVVVIMAIRVGRSLGSIPATLSVIAAIYTVVGIAVLPAVMEQKSDRDLAEAIALVAEDDEPVWEYITQDSLLHYYTAGFYLGDRIRPASSGEPVHTGLLIASPEDAAQLAADNPLISLKLVWEKPRSCDTRRPVGVYRFIQ